MGENSQLNDQTSIHEWLTNFTHWSHSSTAHEDDEKNMVVFQSKLEAYYRLPFSLRHSLHIDIYMGAYCLISLLAQNKHVNNTGIPFLSNHDAFHRFILSLHDIMTCPWWTRQWVIQEIVLPLKATVHYGKFVAPWELFAQAARNYEHHRTNCCESHYTSLHWNDIRHLEHFSRTVMELDNLRQAWQKILKDKGGTSQISLRQLLWQFRERDTSDPRDKIYTLFPLVNYWGKQMPMYPDYNWTTQQIYRASVEKIIAMEDSLLILMGTMGKTLPGLPTWVPDWTSKPSKYELERLKRTQIFDASRGRKPEVRFVDESFMELAGVFFDQITVVSDTMEYEDEDKAHEIFGSWYALLCRDQPITSEYPTGGSRMAAYWRTLCMNTARTLGGEEASNDKGRRYRKCSERYVLESMKRWMDDKGLPLSNVEITEILANHSPNGMPDGKHSVRVPSPKPQFQTEPTWQEKLNFVAVDFAIASATINRRLFFTSNGYMGLAPPNIAKGDLVYVFTGGSMPFIIRSAGERKIPRDGTHTCFQFLGECYLHGIMDGEAMEDYESTKQVTYLI